MTRLFLCLLILAYLVACKKTDFDNSNDLNNPRIHLLGLQVDNSGVLMKNGKPYRGFGVNYFDAFLRILKSPTYSDTSYIKGFRDLKSLDIPFVRFCAGGFWPNNWKLYLNNKDEYFKKLDEFVHNAEKIGVGVIPSLFFNNSTVSDLVGEPVNQWGNANSKTIGFMIKYTEEVCKRYVNSPAIWGWEFANEINLDVETIGNNYPPVSVVDGTPATRTAADKISTDDMIVALREFVKEVRKHDASRIIFSGNSIPRESAYNRYYNRIVKTDNISQYTHILGIQNSNPLNSVTIHIYPESVSTRFESHPTTLKEIVQITLEEANKMKKPLFIGEVGVGNYISDLAEQRNKFYEMIKIIEDAKVPLAAYWVYDFYYHESIGNATLTNSRRYVLEEISKLNGRIKAELKL